MPLNAQAYAALPAAPASTQPKAAPQAKTETPAPAAPVKTAAVEPQKAESKAETPAVTGWVIQLGATDDETKAKEMLSDARARAGKLLAKASPFTEKVTRDGSTLYRARFSGFVESDDAAKACKQLKKSGFNCFAARG